MSANETLSEANRRLFEKVVSNQCTAEDLQLLEQLLLGNPAAQVAFMEYSQLHIDLAIDLRGERAFENFFDSIAHRILSGQSSGPEEPVVLSDLETIQLQASHLDMTANSRWSGMKHYASLAAMLCIAFVCGLLFRGPSLEEKTQPVRVNQDPEEVFVAQLVSNTDLVFDVSDGNYSYRLERGARLRPDQLLNIPKGIAQIVFSNGANLQLEGPTVIRINAQGVPVLQYGKIFAKAEPELGEYTVESEAGTIWLDNDDAVGITLYGSNLQIHGFEGEVNVTFREADSDSEIVSHGQLLRCCVGPKGKRSISHRDYIPELFASRFILKEDLLNIASDYPDLVRKSNPIAYWRFEETIDGVIRNEISEKHSLQVDGSARLVLQEHGNHVIEFGYGVSRGCLTANDAFSELKGSDYSVETWVKPGHFQWGTIMALVQRRSIDRDTENHGLLLELAGETAYHSVGIRPNSIRFLHRSPPGTTRGTSCASSGDYIFKKWQHIVAVKEGAEMHLYVDGQLSATEHDESEVQEDLELIIGQAYSFDKARPLVGQLDEIAIYARALTVKEISSHYRLKQK